MFLAIEPAAAAVRNGIDLLAAPPCVLRVSA